jgi:hypothetical protein
MVFILCCDLIKIAFTDLACLLPVLKAISSETDQEVKLRIIGLKDE